MIAALRKLDDDGVYVQAEELDQEYSKMLRREKYERERDTAHGVVSLTPELATMLQSPEHDADTALLFWDVLSECGHESALYLVLRYCLGYSRLEIAAGLGVSLNRVKYLMALGVKQGKRLKG